MSFASSGADPVDSWWTGVVGAVLVWEGTESAGFLTYLSCNGVLSWNMVEQPEIGTANMHGVTKWYDGLDRPTHAVVKISSHIGLTGTVVEFGTMSGNVCRLLDELGYQSVRSLDLTLHLDIKHTKRRRLPNAQGHQGDTAKATKAHVFATTFSVNFARPDLVSK